MCVNLFATQDKVVSTDSLQDSIPLKPVEKLHLVVGIKHTPPFVDITNENKPYGLSVTLWENIIKNTNYTFEYKQYDNLKDLIDAVAKNEVDLTINPVTVTSERYKKVSFSQPFYVTNTAFLKRKESAIWTFFSNLISWKFIAAVGVLFLLLFGSGVLIWYVERNKNDDFGGRPAKGIADGFWWSAVTMTTVGYGDKAPKSFWGRFIGFIWMFTAVIVISSVTASIASSLTVNSMDGKIHSVRDLRDKKVGTVENSSPAEFLEVYNVEAQEYKTPEEGIKALNDGDIDYLVYDRPVIQHILKSSEVELDLVLSDKALKTDYYSFSFSKENNHFLEQFNKILINELNDIEWIMEIEELNSSY